MPRASWRSVTDACRPRGPPGPDRELEPEWPFLTEANGERTARLAVQQAVTMDLGMMLHQMPGAPRAERLLVRDRGERQPSLQMVADAVQVVVGKMEADVPAFMSATPAVDLAVRDRPAPRAVRPVLVLLVDGKRPCGHGAPDGDRASAPRRSPRCSAWWAGARSRGRAADALPGSWRRARRRASCRRAGSDSWRGRVAQKTNDLLAILVDPPCELLFQSVHGVLLLRENAPPCVLTHAVSTVL